MNAIIVSEFGGPEVMRAAQVDDPVAEPGHVVVRVRAAGVNPVDTYIRAGSYARLPPLPYTPGFDGAGEVESVGAGVTEWAAGDRVYIAALGAWRGTYAERMACTPQQIFRAAGPRVVRPGRQRSACPPRPRIARCSGGRTRSAGKRCSCTAPAAPSASRPCSSPRLRECA